MRGDLKVIRDAARAAGLTQYDPGRPCRQGHVANRFVANATCIECNRKHRKTSYTNCAERIAAASKRKWPEFIARHPEHRLIASERARLWYKQNSEYAKQRIGVWNAKNYAKVREYAAKTRAKKRTSSDGTVTAKAIVALLEKQQGRCMECRADIRKEYDIDHIMPLKLSGQHTISNIQLLCPPCNGRKGAKDPVEFAQSKGRLL